MVRVRDLQEGHETDYGRVEWVDFNHDLYEVTAYFSGMGYGARTFWPTQEIEVD